MSEKRTSKTGAVQIVLQQILRKEDRKRERERLVYQIFVTITAQ